MGVFNAVTKPFIPEEIERPKVWDISTITSGWSNGSQTIDPVKGKDMDEFLQLIMDLESSAVMMFIRKKD